MDPVALAEFWWAVPAAAGAVGAGAWGVHRAGAQRRLAYDAARHELRAAVQDYEQAQHVQRVARTELGRVSAERSAGRASTTEVADAKRALQSAQREARAASATVKARRTKANAERARIPRRSEPGPMQRLASAHDAVLVRWMEYETDPAKAIAYPLMADVRAPEVAAFLAGLDRAQSARPTDTAAKATVQEYIAYRDAVADLEQRFAAAERAARVAAGERDPGQQGWQDAAQELISFSADAIDRAATAAASALAAWRVRDGRRD